MSKASQSLEEILFDLAVQKPTAAERAAFLDHACRDNPTLRTALDELLESHFGAAGTSYRVEGSGDLAAPIATGGSAPERRGDNPAETVSKVLEESLNIVWV